MLIVWGNLASQQRRNNYLPYIFFSLSPPSKDQNRVTNITGTEHITSLKVTSNEMDPAEIRFIRKTFIKERGSEVFRKIRPSPILWEPFKDSATPRTSVGNWETNSQQRKQFCPRPFLLHTVQLLTTSLWTNYEHEIPCKADILQEETGCVLW